MNTACCGRILISLSMLQPPQLTLHDMQAQLDSFGVSHSSFTDKEQLCDAVLNAGGSSATTCSVCYEDYDCGDTLRVLPCKHRFHQSCVDRWLLKPDAERKRHLECPLCNTRVNRRHVRT